MLRLPVLLVVGVMSSTVLAANDTFAQRFALKMPSESVHYAITLPQAVYAASKRGDLGDLRVLNGLGEPVPYSLDAPEYSTVEPAQRNAARWFPLPEESDGVPLGVVIAPDGTLKATSYAPKSQRGHGSLIDLGKQGAQIGALLIHLADRNFQGRVSIETSDNLRDWQTIAETQLLRLIHGNDTILQERIELAEATSRYLRVKWPDGMPMIASIEVETKPRALKGVPVQRAWRAAVDVRRGSMPGEYLFSTDGSYPVDRLQFDLPQINTIARATIYSRADARMPWNAVGTRLLYRLRSASGEQGNLPVEFAVDSNREWRLVVDTRDGGLGSGPLLVKVGWRPATLTFVARGDKPFTLAVGNPSMHSAAHSRAELLMSGTPVIESALVGEPIATPKYAGLPEKNRDSDLSRRILLWSALLMAISTLGGLAYRLARSSRDEESRG
jgi:hypothetical protein